ncbi:hypothetical protein SAMN05192553_106121 [Cyclobacterium xiamenense]|uniref:Uncharacterized protein n=1 Tax=Cyclobacterium xiamenense TaxID=1297121 RepID=A0A1H7AAU0_9BACT|nr:hypothetical protein SAMN05192553_106121 [Cyclobacterium xiamenense]
MLALNTSNLSNTNGLFSSWKNTSEPFGFPNLRPKDCFQTRASSFSAEAVERRFSAASPKLARSERSQKGRLPAKSEVQTGCGRCGKFRKDSVREKALGPTLFFIGKVRETNTSFCSSFLSRNFPGQDAGFLSASQPVWIRFQVPFVGRVAVRRTTTGGSGVPVSERASVYRPGFLEKMGIGDWIPYYSPEKSKKRPPLLALHRYVSVNRKVKQ